MDCTFIRLYLDRYERGQLDSQLREGIRQHLKDCKDCSNELIEIQEVNAMIDQIEIPSLPLDFTERVLEKVKITPIYPKKDKSLIQEWGKWGISLVASGLILLLINITSMDMNIATITANIENDYIDIQKIIEYSPVNIFNKGIEQIEFIVESYGNRG